MPRPSAIRFCIDSLQARERNFAKRALVRDVAIEFQASFLQRVAARARPSDHSPDASQHAVGIDRDAGRRAAADRVATTTAADLGERSLLGDYKTSQMQRDRRSVCEPDGVRHPSDIRTEPWNTSCAAIVRCSARERRRPGG